jgi:hypothetical protein
MGSSAALVTEIVDYRGHFIFNASGPERTLPKAISWSGGVRLSFGSLNLVCGERQTKARDSLRASC